MSTQPSPSAKAAAKRRAAARRRNRDLMRRFGALFLVGIFILGTVTTLFVASTQSTTPTTVPTVVTQQTVTLSTPVPTTGGIDDIISLGEKAEANNDWATAAKFYLAALGISKDNPTLHFKYGRALIKQNKDYDKAIDNLQQAINLNPSASFVAEAQSLIDANKDKVTPIATAGASGAITATSTITK